MTSETLIDPAYEVIGEPVILRSYDQAKRIHTEHLTPHRVALPQRGSAPAVWLGILMTARGIPDHEGWIAQDDVSVLTRRVIPDAGKDQQVRHLKCKGWNLETRDMGGKRRHRISNPYIPSPEHAREMARRETENIRMLAISEGGDDSTFDDKGGTRAVASPRPAVRASRDVQSQVLRALNSSPGIGELRSLAAAMGGAAENARGVADACENLHGVIKDLIAHHPEAMPFEKKRREDV